MSFLHELEELTLAHHRVGEVESVELNLSGTVAFGVLGLDLLQQVDEVIIEGAVHFELQGADRVRHALEEVTLSVCEVVHRIDTPLRTRAVVRYLDDAVDDGIAEVHVGRSHVNLRAQNHRSFGELPSVHTAEEVEALCCGTITEGTRHARGGRCALLRGDLFGCLLVDVGVTREDELFGELIQALEVVRCVVDISPEEA